MSAHSSSQISDTSISSTSFDASSCSLQDENLKPLCIICRKRVDDDVTLGPMIFFKQIVHLHYFCLLTMSSIRQTCEYLLSVCRTHSHQLGLLCFRRHILWSRRIQVRSRHWGPQQAQIKHLLHLPETRCRNRMLSGWLWQLLPLSMRHQWQLPFTLHRRLSLVLLSSRSRSQQGQEVHRRIAALSCVLQSNWLLWSSQHGDIILLLGGGRLCNSFHSQAMRAEIHKKCRLCIDVHHVWQDGEQRALAAGNATQRNFHSHGGRCVGARWKF